MEMGGIWRGSAVATSCEPTTFGNAWPSCISLQPENLKSTTQGDTGDDLGLPGGCLRGCLGDCLRGCCGGHLGMIWVDDWDTIYHRGGAAEGRPHR